MLGYRVLVARLFFCNVRSALWNRNSFFTGGPWLWRSGDELVEVLLPKGGHILVKIAGEIKSGKGEGIWRVAVIFLILLLGGCGAKIPFVKDSDDNVPQVILKNPPKSIAILPFGNKTGEKDIDEFVRRTFYSHLSARPYKDIELYEVDRKLRRYNLLDYEKLSHTSAKRLGRILHSDAVVIGEVTEFQRVYAGLYSQMAVGASITVWDTRSGKKIWSDEHVTRNHEGGIPLAITDLAMIGIRSGLNLTEEEKVKTVDELSRRLTSRVPVPDLNGNRRGSKLVSLKRLTKSKIEASESQKLRSLKKQTKDD
jgi:hypothetical protein